MKKIVSLLLVVVILLTFSSSAIAAENTVATPGNIFSYYDDNGDIVTVVVSRSNMSATSKVYVNGVLTQKSIADAATKTIETEVYDIVTNTHSASQTTNQIESRNMNGFSNTVRHLPLSSERISTNNASVQTRASIYNEPVENDGLYPSGYGDGFSYLGSYGGFYYAPEVYGYLYRAYRKTYDGETKYWSWDAGDTLSAISAYISLFGGPVSAITGLLVFAAGEILAYYQAIDLDTYTFDYHYIVRVYEENCFTAQRNITYWYIYHRQSGTEKWVEKSFNYGFSMANTEMVKFGIDNYLASN